ncbi:glutaredoxin family protein [Cellulosimicrobium sp. 22601]|uniref:glutaredoxin family protein n=1 Tax=unclassified Cellulosimicrobium TaxID=2624466 RepID=UPI003F83B786
MAGKATVQVYSKPACVQCDATYRALDKKGIEYVTVDVTRDAAALAFIRDELGYLQVPVVVAGEEHWSGFRPDRLAAVVRDVAA